MRRIEPNILLLPVHRNIHRVASEGAWAINIMQSVTVSFKNVISVVGEIDNKVIERLQSPVKNSLISLHAGYDYSFKSDLFFYGKLFITGLKIIRNKKIDIIHHVMPLGIGAGFSPIFMFVHRQKKIIGPLLYPYSTPDAKSFIEGFKFNYGRDYLKIFGPFFTFLFVMTLRSSDVIIMDSVETLGIIEKIYPFRIILQSFFHSQIYVVRGIEIWIVSTSTFYKDYV